MCEEDTGDVYDALNDPKPVLGDDELLPGSNEAPATTRRPSAPHQQRTIHASTLEAGDVDMWRSYKDVTEYFRQFGFFDTATYDGFIEKVMLPNASWSDLATHHGQRSQLIIE